MSSQAVGVRGPDGVRLRRYLPLSLVVTLAVTLLPLVAVAQLGPARSPAAVGLHVLSAVALSIALARLLAAVWTRHGLSSDLVFGDLLLWGWARRALAERRLDATARQLAGARAADGDHVALLQRMSTLLEARDPYTHGHSLRVARHAEQIARAMGLPREQIEKVRAAALVHDIGKINVPRSILTKPGRLTEGEFALVKRHPGDGAEMVADLGDPALTAVVRHHHERMDGTGYPDGLAGEDIPLGARVIAVADAFDAITSTRAYRKPRTHRQALDVLEQEAGTQLDPAAVAAFVSYYAAGRSVGLASVVAVAPQRLLTGIGGVSSGIGASVAPIAQTACGVGGVALIGACIAGPVLPASSTDAAPARAVASRQHAEQKSRGSDERPAPPGSDRGGGRTRERPTAPVAELGDPAAKSDGSEPVAPRTLEVPGGDASPGGGGGQSGGRSGGGSAGGVGGGGVGGGVTVPELPPVLPDPETALEPVTDLLPQVPVPAPAIDLP